MRLAGKAAIVTGAAKGIGRAIALRFGAEGADVLVADINGPLAEQTAAEIRTMGRRAVAVTTDISDLAQIDRMVAAAVAELDHIDILVNNAGIAQFVPFFEVTPEVVDRIWRVNQWGTFWCCQRVAQHMAARGGGKIVNMSSLSEEVGTPELTHYSMTKGAIKILTRCLALELAPHHINVNAIGPGIIDTDISAEYFSMPENRAAANARIPIGRMGAPEDVAGAAVFLASSDADYITGTTVFVDGGLTAA